jgi:hypothetical protein
MGSTCIGAGTDNVEVVHVHEKSLHMGFDPVAADSSMQTELMGESKEGVSGTSMRLSRSARVRVLVLETNFPHGLGISPKTIWPRISE